jgi:putative membrane-bound dehydrogenase-like protein
MRRTAISSVPLWLAALGVSALVGGTWHVEPVRAATFRFGDVPITVPDGFVVERIAAPPLVDRPVTVAFDEEGRLYVAESSGSNAKLVEQQADPRHRILRLEDTDGDGVYDRRTVFADGLMMLQGTLWHRGSLYVCAAPEILRLTDTDGDGVADERVVWHDGTTLTSCGNDLHGPALGRDGRLYFTKGAFAEQTHDLVGRPGWKTRASHVFRARADRSDLEVVLTGGMDNPVDVAFTTAGERLLSATFLQQPAAGRRDGVVHAIYGGVYGKQHGVLAGHERTGDLMPVLVHLGGAAACGLHVHSGFGLGAEYRDNAFVCAFNLRGVSRHVLVPEGATYVARDEPFLTADSADFHPTDVVEDADGALVVVDTGGWYKLCCPTSQLEKPAVLGAIYRVRRADAEPLADPRGRAIDWAGLDAAGLARLLADPRPAVVERATEGLARLGAGAVAPIAALLDPSPWPGRDARLAAVWALARVDGPTAIAAARQALVDPDADVRRAAVHVAALVPDAAAAPALTGLLRDPDAGVARVAAEALGRIGGEPAVRAVLAACPRAAERALEHALTYALIEAGLPGPLLDALDAADARVRRAALVALDQMPLRHPGAPPPDRERLRRAVVAACRDDDAGLRDAGLWLVSEHPEWADALAGEVIGIVARIATARAADPPREAEAERIADRLARCAVSPAIAERLAAACGGRDDTGVDATGLRAAALDVMDRARPKEVPDVWVDALVALLPSVAQPAGATARPVAGAGRAAADATTLGPVVRTLAGMSLSKSQRQRLEPALLRIAGDTTLPPALVTLSLRVAGPMAALPDGVVARLVAVLRGGAGGAAAALDASPLDRAAAAAVLAATPLSPEALEAVAATFDALPGGDVAVLLPAVTAQGGTPLVRALAALAAAPRPEAVPRDLLEKAVAALPESHAAAGRALVARVDAARAGEREAYERLAVSLPAGDAARGHAVFLSNKAACTTCHALGYAGGRIGPELSKIGAIRTPRDLLEAIVLPSAAFVRSYEPVVVVTAEGRAFSGVIREENDAEVVLQTSATATERIPRDAIESLQAGTVSLMPKGYDTLLSPQELADLVAFLARAK